jgi:hypothetical protein
MHAEKEGRLSKNLLFRNQEKSRRAGITCADAFDSVLKAVPPRETVLFLMVDARPICDAGSLL